MTANISAVPVAVLPCCRSSEATFAVSSSAIARFPLNAAPNEYRMPSKSAASIAAPAAIKSFAAAS